MNTKLDKSRPYGTISPPHNGASFEQDGQFFDGQGLPVSRSAPAPAPSTPAPAPKTGEGASDDFDPDGDILAQLNQMKWPARKAKVNELAGRAPKNKAQVEEILKDAGLIA